MVGPALSVAASSWLAPFVSFSLLFAAAALSEELLEDELEDLVALALATFSTFLPVALFAEAVRFFTLLLEDELEEDFLFLSFPAAFCAS